MEDKSFIQWLSDKKYGLAGTLLVHMAALVIILLVKVGQAQHERESMVFVDLKLVEQAILPEITEKPDARTKSPERLARNIAVNQAEDRIERYDDYKNYEVNDSKLSDRAADRQAKNNVNQAIREIIKDNNLNPNDKEVPIKESKPIDFYKARKVEEEQVYKGPTNISYKLDKRSVAYLPVPVYLCKGGATVQIDIRVGQRGKVELATVNGSGTDTSDPCFLDAARDAAQRTRFNFSTTAPQLQQGYIIYHFVAQ